MIVFREIVVEELDNALGENDCNIVEIEGAWDVRDAGMSQTARLGSYYNSHRNRH